MPRKDCIELKALKMYLLAYRDLGIFYENAVNKILHDIAKAIDPEWCVVRGEFTPRGGCVTVSSFSRGDAVGIEVCDSGPGIPGGEAAAVLRRFYRAETSRNTSGSGLGLSLVAAVARLHGMDLAIADARPGCRITLARRETGAEADRG
jgi:nitrogen fixation/metabolism regulation signal transduction histidine kinase